MSRHRRTRTRASLGVLAFTVSLVLSGLAQGGDPARATTGGSAGPADPVPVLSAATYADPPTTVRPKYRWWVPQGATEDAELRAEITQMADAGAGGVELAPWFDPGSKTGFGTAEWKHKLQVILAAAAEHGMTVDQNLGLAYPANVPTSTDINDPAIAQQLVYATQTVASGTTFSGALPAVTTPDGARSSLVAVVAARCVQLLCLDPGGPKQVDRASVVDLTSRVVGNTVTWTAPADGGTWTLFNFQQTADGLRVTGFDQTAAFTVDHLSATGAKALADFFDANLLTPDTQALIDKMPGPASFFEDSLELGSNQLWTTGFGNQFTSRRGYSVAAALPALTGIGTQGTTAPAYDFSDGSGDRVRRDYRQTWGDLYVDQYARTLESWANTHGMTFRVQPYGTPIQSGAAAMEVGIPEGESINFGSPNPLGAEQNYRVLAGGAHVAGKTRLSTECCGIFSGAYRTFAGGPDVNQSLTNFADLVTAGRNGNVDSIYKAYAGGVTQVVWHGFPYLKAAAGLASSQNGLGGTWPGYLPWAILGTINVGEMFGPRLPQWDDYRAVNDALSRDQLVLRQGSPSLDLSVYWQDLGLTGQSVSAPETPAHQFSTTGPLTQAGYTFEYHPQQAYLGSGSGAGPVFDPQTGTLFPGHGSQKALLLNQQATMPLDAAQRLLSLARQGLKVVVVGDAPAKAPGDASGSADAAVAATMTQLLALPTVRRAADEEAAVSALASLGVRPAATVQTELTTPWETVRRDAGPTQYYWLYNPGATAQTQRVSLAGQGRPFLLDSWTGKVTPVADYTVGTDGVTTSVTIPAYSSVVYAVTTSTADPFTAPVTAVHAVGSTGTPFYRPDGSLAVATERPGAVRTTLSDGRVVDTPVETVAAPLTLGTWSLNAESWTPGASYFETRKTPVGPLTVNALPGGSLPPWTAIPGLTTASGIGTYTATVDLGAGWTGGFGATLDLGAAVDTVSVSVNGRALPAINPSSLQIPADHLHSGSNTITVQVASTLFNAVQSQTLNRAFATQLPQQYGLLGPVTLRPRGIATVVDAPVDPPATSGPSPVPTAAPSATPTGLPTTASPPSATVTSPARTRTRIRLPRPVQVVGRSRVRVLMQVVGPAASTGTVGTVVLRLDGRTVKTYRTAVTLKSGRTVQGRTYRVPRRLAVGRHTLQATFTPLTSAAFQPSASRAITLTVVRAR